MTESEIAVDAMEYNSTLLTKHQKEEIIRLVLGVNGFTPGTVELPEAVGNRLREFGLKASAYITISGLIRLGRLGVPSMYSGLEVDVKDFPDGNPSCSHALMDLYWETGGSSMESGKPHSYLLCFHCGHHPRKQSLFSRLCGLFRGL